jgi:hypothetical protein
MQQSLSFWWFQPIQQPTNNTTTRHLLWTVLRASLGYEGTGGMVLDLQFSFVDTSQVRELHSTLDHDNTATSSLIHTKQVTPSWFRLELFNHLESLLIFG